MYMKKLIIITLLLLLPFFISAENNLKELLEGNAYDFIDNVMPNRNLD